MAGISLIAEEIQNRREKKIQLDSNPCRFKEINFTVISQKNILYLHLTLSCSLFQIQNVTDRSTDNVPYMQIHEVDTNTGNAVAQFIDGLRYTPEGRGFDSRWGHWEFKLT